MTALTGRRLPGRRRLNVAVPTANATMTAGASVTATVRTAIRSCAPPSSKGKDRARSAATGSRIQTRRSPSWRR